MSHVAALPALLTPFCRAGQGMGKVAGMVPLTLARKALHLGG